MTGPTRTGWATLAADEERYRPLYARVLGLRFVNPGGVLCFLFFEGAVALAALLALAELVSWWAVLLLPAAVAVMVKLNDIVAASVVRTAALVPEQERDRFRRQIEPAVGRAPVPARAAERRGGTPAGHPVDPATGRASWIPAEVVSSVHRPEPSGVITDREKADPHRPATAPDRRHAGPERRPARP